MAEDHLETPTADAVEKWLQGGKKENFIPEEGLKEQGKELYNLGQQIETVTRLLNQGRETVYETEDLVSGPGVDNHFDVSFVLDRSQKPTNQIILDGNVVNWIGLSSIDYKGHGKKIRDEFSLGEEPGYSIDLSTFSTERYKVESIDYSYIFTKDGKLAKLVIKSNNNSGESKLLEKTSNITPGEMELVFVAASMLKERVEDEASKQLG